MSKGKKKKSGKNMSGSGKNRSSSAGDTAGRRRGRIFAAVLAIVLAGIFLFWTVAGTIMTGTA